MKATAAAAVSVALLLLLRLPAAVAAEPVYTVTLPDKNRAVITVAAGRAPDGGRWFRVYSVPPTVAKYDFTLDATMAFAPGDASLKRAILASGVAGDPGANRVEMVRTDRGGGGSAPPEYALRVPERAGTTTFSGRLVSLIAAPASIGRQVDWSLKGPQEFIAFVDRGVPQPQFLPISFTVEGAETLELADGALKARKLRYDAPAFPNLAPDHRTGTLYVGPRGEVVRCDTPLFGTPIKARGPMRRSARAEGVLEMPFEVPAEVFVREKYRDAKTREVTNDVRDYTLASAVTDLKGSPLSLESPWMGRKMTATVGPGPVVSWTLEGTPPTPVSTAGGAWLWPYFFAPEVWEGAGPRGIGALTVGQKVSASYVALLGGVVPSVPCTLERLADVTAPNPAGGDVVLTRYRFTAGPVVYEVYNDRTRLVHLASADGGSVARQGWERFAARVTPPAPVAAAAAAPAPKP